MIINLNQVVLDHKGQPVLIDNKLSATLADIILKVLPQVRTTTNEEAIMAFALLVKIQDSTSDKLIKAIEVSDEEFAVVNQIISREALIVKHFFLNMVNQLNPNKE